MFIYDEEQLWEFFGTAPHVSDEYGVDLTYEFDDGAHRLVFAFNADTSDCSVQILDSGSGNPLLTFVYLGSPGAKVVPTKVGPYLEVGAPNSAPGSTEEWFVPSEGLRIHLRPHLRVVNFRMA